MVATSNCFCGTRLPYGETCDCSVVVNVTVGGSRFLQVNDGNQTWFIDTKQSRCVSVPLFAAKEVKKALTELFE